jgi:rhamnulokinase
MSEKKYIGFDLGAESGRCFVALLRDGKITLTGVHRFPTHQVRFLNSLHWNAPALADELLAGLQKAGNQFGAHFDGIGVDTWGVDYLLIDKDDRMLGLPYHYRDDRTDQIMDEAFRIVPREAFYQSTGTQFARYNTVFQLLAEKKTKTNLLNTAQTLLFMPDFLTFVLTGKKIAEYTIASTSGLIDPIQRNWNWPLLDALGLPKTIFPAMVEPGTFVSPLAKEIADRCGLGDGIPVFAGAGHDTAAAVASVPGGEYSWAFLSSGTWSLMGVEVDKPIMTLEAMQHNFSNEGGLQGTTRFLKNILGLWPLQECRKYWAQKGTGYSYEQLTRLAQDYGYAHAGIDFDDPRFLKPGDMPNKIIDYLQETKQKTSDEPGFITRVILESLAISYRSTMAELEQLTGKSIPILHAVGGGIQNELLNQMAADAIEREVIAGPVEGTIFGNIGTLAMAAGDVRNLAEWRTVVKNSVQPRTYTPSGRSDYWKH